MSNLVALEWDAREARICIGRTHGSGVAVEQAFALSLKEDESSPTAQIVEALKQRGVSKSEALVAIGRSSIELRQMQMPPCPDDELVDMVRFQAMRQFTGITDAWPLDFVPLHRLNDDEAVHVLAAAINPEVIDPVEELCRDADLSLTKILLRPFAAASLMKPATSESQCRALVDMLADEADLTVLVGDDVVFVRTVRLPATNDMAVRANALMGEIRRTIPAARNQAGGREVESVTLCGDHAELGPLEEIIKSKMGKAVEFLDPFSAVGARGELASHPPENPGRYASLIGAMNAHAGRSTVGIDFANPRKRPTPKSKKGRYAFVGALAAVAVALVCFIGWFELHRLGKELAKLEETFDQNEKQTERMREATEHAIAVKNLVGAKDIDWLQQLRDFSDSLPDPDLVLISNLTMSPNPKDPGGKMSVRGFIDDSSTIDELRRRWDAPGRQVDAGPVVTDRQYDKFPYRITEALYVLPSAQQAPSDTPDNTESASPVDEGSRSEPPEGDDDSGESRETTTPEEPKADEPKADEAKPDEPDPEAPDPDDGKPDDGKPDKPDPGDGKPDATESGDGESGDGESNEKSTPAPKATGANDLTTRPRVEDNVKTASAERSPK